MKDRKNKGASHTKSIKNPIGNKGIRISNRSTGTRVRKPKLSPKAEANFRKVKEFMAQKLKYVRSEEFSGKGKSIEVLDVDTEATGKFGPSVQISLREPKNGMERIWNTTSIRALRAVLPLFENGVTFMHVWTRGTGMDTQYYARELGNQGSKRVKMGQRTKAYKNSR